MADFNVSLGADMGPLIADLAKARAEGKITAKEYAAGMKTIEKSIKATEKEAKRLAAAARGFGKDGKAAFDAVKNAAEGFGGKIGGSVAMVEKFAKAAAGIAGPLGPIAGVAVAGGLALGGLAVAGGVVAEKMIAAADAAADFARKNEDLIPPETLAGLLAFDDAMDTAKVTASATAAIFVGELAPGFEDVARLAIKAGLIVQDHMGLATAAVRGLVDGVVGELVPGMWLLSTLTGGAITPTKVLTAAMEAADEATGSYDERVDALIGRTRDLRTATVAKTKTTREGTAAEREAAAAAKERADAERKYFADWLAETERRAAWTAEVVAMAEAETRAQTAAAQAVAAAQEESARRSRVAWEQFGTSSLVAVQNFGDLAIQSAQENDKISATQAERRIATAFALQKTAAISQAVMTGADAFLKMVAFLAPFSGPAAIPLAAGITAPLVASQVALISSQKPPTFADGGMVGDRVNGDHVMVAADPSEGILTREGVANAGGPKAVADLNRGAVASPVVHVYVDGIEVARALAKGGSGKALAKALTPWLGGRGV